MPLPDKPTVFNAFHDLLRTRLAATAAITAMARDEATNEETRPENKYDTRALEASYLAAGQGERLADLRRLLTWFGTTDPVPHRRVGPGSLVAITRDGPARWLLLAPQGGERIHLAGEDVELLGLRSPLGMALLGLEEDDEAEVVAPRGTTTWALLTVR